MEDGSAEKSRYFRDISRAFLRLRGAPFILSARELHVLDSWEKEGIPAKVVLAGLEQVFRRPARKALSDRAKISLAYCDVFVRKAFEQHRERAVGGRRQAGGRLGRKERIHREVKAFLEESQEALPGLEDLFRRALRMVEGEGEREADLARLEKEIENVLLKRCPADERRRAERQVLRENPPSRGEAHEEAVRAVLLKNLRVRFRIPFVSYPYY